MQRKKLITIAAVVAILAVGQLFVAAPAAHALACASTYPEKRDLNAKVRADMKLLNVACEAKSSVVGSVKKGQVVKVVARAGAWYQVIAVDGTVGWAAQSNFNWGNYKLTNPDSVALAKKAEEEEAKKMAQAGKLSSATIAKMKGRILASLTNDAKLFHFTAAGTLVSIGTVDELSAVAASAGTGATPGTFVRNSKGILMYVHPDTKKAYAIDINEKGIMTLRSFAMALSDKMLSEIDPDWKGHAVAAPSGEAAPALPQ